MRPWAVILLQCLRAQIRIIQPSVLANQGIIYGSTATFGAPSYSDRIAGRLLYAEETDRTRPHCTGADYDLSAFQTKSHRTANHKIKISQKIDVLNVILVKRGGCSFVTKARVAQQEKGAHAVIFVDTRFGSDNRTKTDEEIQNVVVSDDGHGADIHIPSVLVSYERGTKLIDAARQVTYPTDDQVLVALEWNVPQKYQVVVDFWFIPGRRSAARFLDDFKLAAEALDDRMKFVPHYSLFSLDADAATDGDGLCVKNGRVWYCAPNPDVYQDSATGLQAVQESLRQLCLWEKLSLALDGYNKAFWEYMSRHYQLCTSYGSDGRFFNRECSIGTMRTVGVPEEVIESVERCAEPNGKEAEALLRREVAGAKWGEETLRVNGWRYTGTLDATLFTSTVCGAFIHAPDVCTWLPFARDPSFLNVLLHGMTVITLLVVMCNALFAVYQRYLFDSVRTVLKEEIVLEVRNQMADYSPLAGDTLISPIIGKKTPTLTF